MNKYTVTIDTGTTNTRITLWNKNKEFISMIKSEIGVRNTAIDGNNQKLKYAIRNGIQQLLENNKITYQDINKIIASGMITSNVGLLEIPHVKVPVGVDDLAKNTKSVLIEEICPIPIFFIPGIKNSIDCITLSNIEAMDIMRGEEVECIAIMESLQMGDSYLVVLPGSHTKFISINVEKKIDGCLTTLNGELLSAVTNNTIIADAVERQFVDDEYYDKEMVLMGYNTSKKTGIGRASFLARILNQFAISDKKKIANYVLGAVLQSDIEAVKYSDALNVTRSTTVIVSGKNPLRRALLDLLYEDGYFIKIKEYIPEVEAPLSALGSYIVSEKIKDTSMCRSIL